MFKASDADIMACSSKGAKNKGYWIGTKSFFAKKESLSKILDWIGNTMMPLSHKWGNMENRFGRAVAELNLVELRAPKQPNDHQFAYKYDDEGNCIGRGTWGEMLGFRHLAGERKIRGQLKLKKVEAEYMSNP
jgi:hypothetical protein